MLTRLAPILAVGVLLAVSGCSGGPGGGPTASPKPAHAATGCALISQAEASSIAGVSFGPGKSTPLTKETPTDKIPVDEHQACEYISGSKNLEFYLNTLTTPAAAYEAKVWVADKNEVPASTNVSIDGLPGLRMPMGKFDLLVFYKGQVVVDITATSVKAGAAEAVGKLIAQRM